jgi:hypothetical protein
MLGFSTKRLAVAVSLALTSTVATGGAAHALLDNGGNFSIVVPVNVAVPIGICSAQSIGTSNNANHGVEFERNDAKSEANSEARCDVLNNLLRNVSNVLNGNFVGNLTGNLSGNLNDALTHNLNGNLLDILAGGSLISL